MSGVCFALFDSSVHGRASSDAMTSNLGIMYHRNGYKFSANSKTTLAKLPAEISEEIAEFNNSLLIGNQCFEKHTKKANKKVLIRKRPFACSAVPSVNSSCGNASEMVEGPKTGVPFQHFFRENSEKVLTTEIRNVFLEIFPLSGNGSLKFTLCD